MLMKFLHISLFISLLPTAMHGSSTNNFPNQLDNQCKQGFIHLIYCIVALRTGEESPKKEIEPLTSDCKRVLKNIANQKKFTLNITDQPNGTSSMRVDKMSLIDRAILYLNTPPSIDPYN